MSIVIVSLQPGIPMHIHELRPVAPLADAAVPVIEPADGSDSYWRIPSGPEGDDAFLYDPVRPAPVAAPAEYAPERTGWDPFANLTADEIASELAQDGASLFSYSLW